MTQERGDQAIETHGRSMEDGKSNDQGAGAIPQDRPQSTFDSKGSFHVNEPVGSATISPAGRDVALASRLGLHIIDLDNPYSPPRHLPHRTSWEVADVQWSPFAARDYWIASTSNQNALIWNVALPSARAVEHTLQAHTRALTDINFSAHEPDLLATCSVDSFVHVWDLRAPARPSISFADWYAGATQVKWNRQDSHILASSHDEKLHIWDTRKDSYPLKSIEAHTTKIYGIDWNRVETTQLLTCSLDRTIKIWDYAAEDEDMLTRTIHTPYPVWRARHTPFGYGILVMPQRGNSDLHLYDRRLQEGEARDADAQPVHTFEGHKDQVKEFLWRVRHGEDDGKDNRTFQLVSWGADKHLWLHPMSEEVLDKIGYHKGQGLHYQQRFSRKGAVYRTFHDFGNVQQLKPVPGTTAGDRARRGSAISEALNKSALKTAKPHLVSSLRGEHMPGMRIRSGEKKQANPISWMKGVKISTRDDASSPRDSVSALTTSQIGPWDAPESLGDEITSAGERYKKVVFEEVNVVARHVSVSLNGPWGADKQSVHLRMAISFPKTYPEEEIPEISIEKTSSISDEAYRKMSLEMKVLCEAYREEKQASLEAILRYLLGDQDLEHSLAWLQKLHNVLNDDFEIPETAESSTDDEDNLIGHLTELKQKDFNGSVGDLTKLKNANVPLPKHCAALFAPSGKLVCFFATKAETPSLLNSVTLGGKHGRLGDSDLFESFGTLQNALSKHADGVKADDTDSGSSEYSYDSSSSSFDSSISDNVDGDIVPFSGFSLWGAGAIPKAPRSIDKSVDQSQQLSARSLIKAENAKRKMHVSIYNLDDQIYPRKVLAEDYMMLGKGEIVCSHNAWVARNSGLEELANVWDFARLIVCDAVPLEITPDLLQEENISVVARRGIVHIKRRDSGLGFSFDFPQAVKEPKLTAHVKWGTHPLSNDYLIKAIFDRFEELGDVQTLAMLSCVFHEPAASPGAASALAFQSESQLPMHFEAPGFSLNYWPTRKVGKSFAGSPNAAKPSQIASSRSTPAVFASSVSSDGRSSINATIAGTLRPHPRGIPLRRGNSQGMSKTRSFGTSPEHVLRRSSSIVGNAINRVALMLSNSPPLHRKEAAVELSTSAPSASIPIGMARARGELTAVRFSDPRSASVFGDVGDNDTLADEDGAGVQKLRIKLKNQDLFDDEACASIPLMPTRDMGKHRLWRDEYAAHLDAWNMPQQYLELLAFNHFPSRFSHSTEQSTPKKSQRLRPLPHTGPLIGLICTNCHWSSATTMIASNPTAMERCPFCDKQFTRPTCNFCLEPVETLYKSCMNCGHVAHTTCYEDWLDANYDENIEDECEVVCGCRCAENTVLERERLEMRGDDYIAFESGEDTDTARGSVGGEEGLYEYRGSSRLSSRRNSRDEGARPGVKRQGSSRLGYSTWQ